MTDLSLIANITLALGIGYIFTALYLLSHPAPQKSRPKNLPKVAILVAMRDEEDHIADCLTSLGNQNYPLHLHTVFIIDDRSTDRSAEIVKPFLKQHENFSLFSIEEDLDGLSGKMNALAQVLDTLDHEIVLITDADCQAPATWIQTQVDYFDNETGMVGGLTVLEPLPGMNPVESSLFGKVQTLDWIFLQTLAAATANAGLPVSILGNNFGFRLQAYRDIGKFKALGFSVTEDFALLKAIDQSGKWTIKYALDPAGTIYSKPVDTFTEFLRQRKRWVMGGKSMRLWGYFITGLSFIAHLSILATLFTANWEMSAALGIGLIFGIDYFILKRELRKTGLERLKKYFLFFEIFYLGYTLFFGFTFPFFRKVKWKNRTY